MYIREWVLSTEQTQLHPPAQLHSWLWVPHFSGNPELDLGELRPEACPHTVEDTLIQGFTE